MTALAADISTMSPSGKSLLGAMRRNLELLVEHEKVSRLEVEQIVEHLVAHVRSWKPQALLGLPDTIDPVAAVSRDLTDGAKYELSRKEDAVVVSLRDQLDGHAVVALAPIEIVRLRHDLSAVAQGGSK